MLAKLITAIRHTGPRPPTESVWLRAVADSWNKDRVLGFAWQLVLAFVLWLLAKWRTNSQELIANLAEGAVTLLALAALAVVIRLAWNLFRAPYRQRDEARSLLAMPASEAGVDRDRIAKTFRQMLTLGMGAIEPQFKPAARLLSPHIASLLERLVLLISCGLNDGHRKRDIADAVQRWIPKYADGDQRLDIRAFTDGTTRLREAIASIQADDINANAIAVGDSWATWTPPAASGCDGRRLG